MTMRTILPAIVAVMLPLAPAAVVAADREPGRAKAAACALCHGQNGISTLANTPNLAGQPAIYVEAQLKNYRSGARRHEVMSLIAKPLSDADIADLAGWYASIRIQSTLP